MDFETNETKYLHVLKEIEEINEKLDDVDTIKSRLDKVEHEHEILQELNGLVRGDRKSGTPGLKSIVYGSEALGVKPIRVVMKEFATDLEIVLDTHARWRWLLGILSLTSVAGVIGWILFLRDITGVP